MIQAFDPDADGYHSAHPVTILIGPPGTGKTSAVLSSWLIPALAEIDPRDILATTFTKGGAKEMRDRLVNATGRDEHSLRRTCSTIHSEAYRLVRIENPSVGVWDRSKAKPAKTVAEALAERERKTGTTTPAPGTVDLAGAPILVEEVEIDDPWERMATPCTELRDEAVRIWDIARHKWPEKICPVDSPWFVQLISRAVNWAEKSKFSVEELAAEIPAYEADKAAAGCVDFTDMLVRALDILPPRRALIVVDEAQDLSPLQVLLVERWAMESDRLVWVGDPDQGIYRFSGADGERLTDLMRSNAAVRSLQHSYRVPAAAHALARKVILQNQDRVDAPYSPAPKPGHVLSVYDDDEEAIRYAEEAARSSSVYVLGRTCQRLSTFAKILTEQGIPFANERGASAMKQTKMLGLVLALCDILEGRWVLKECLRALVDSIPGRPRNSFLTRAKKDALAAVRAIEDGQGVRPVALADFGLDRGEIEARGTVVGCLEHINRLAEATPQLRILERYGAKGLRDAPTITLTTMHGAKGREAQTVVVDLQVPYPVAHTLSGGCQEDIEAERRVLYVALTRTLDTLVLVRRAHDLGERVGF